MDGYGFAILIIGALLYFMTKKKYPAFLFVSGIGAGIVIGAMWAMSIINGILR